MMMMMMMLVLVETISGDSYDGNLMRRMYPTSFDKYAAFFLLPTN
jgi:hypothetical protein